MNDSVALRLDGPVAVVTLSNPGARNALTWKMYDELAQACERIAAEESVAVTVVRGAGGDAFAAGTDIRQFNEFATAQDGVDYERRIAGILDRLAAVPVPTVAVVEGPAVGGGLAIAAMCDLVIATPAAFFSVPVARTLGNCISANLLARLYSAFGRPRTLAMLLTASRIGASEAHAAGFVHRLIQPSDVDAEIERLVQRIAGCAPLTLAAVKAADRLLAGGPIEDEEILRTCYGSRDFREGVDAFVHRRPPAWEGR